MRSYFIHIFFFLATFTIQVAFGATKSINYEFAGNKVSIDADEKFFVKIDSAINDEIITQFYNQLNESDYSSIVDELNRIKQRNQLNDWLFYQLIRATAERVSPKANNFYQYTLYKWFLLSKCGYDATVSFSQRHLLFYVKSEENIYGIPYFVRDGQQYICLNYHDYGQIDFTIETPHETSIRIPEGQKAFSYKITNMPEFKPSDYAVKEIEFNYRNQDYHFQIKLNPQVKNLFTNYPVADFETYFNIPMSQETYSSLIPELKKYIGKMSQKEGVDYLMRFTRYSFLYKNDQSNFGIEKRLSPEQTLLSDYSDCDDRAGLFFYLVKEIYNLPMIVMLYPTHVTIAVKFEKPIGTPIEYNGRLYSVCDPTPQKKDMKIGNVATNLKQSSYEVVYEYLPKK